MVKGLGAGMLSGGVVGAIVMSGLSLYAPLPQERISNAPRLQATTAAPASAPTAADPVESVAPSGQNDALAPADDAITVPPSAPTDAADQDAATPLAPSGATAPTAEVANSQTASNAASNTTVAAESANTESLSAQDTQSASLAAEPATQDAQTTTAPSDVVTAQAGPTDTATAAQSQAVEAQTDATAPRVQASAETSERIVGQEQVAEPIGADASANTDADAAAAPTQTAALATTPKPTLPTIGTTGAAEPASADTPIVLPTPSVPGVVTNRLPSVGGASPATEPAPEAAVAQATPQEPQSALDLFATPVEGTEGKSLMSFVLIDSGADGVPRADLTKLAIPVTVAIDPVMDDAAAIMAEYRAAGVEVVVIANDLPVSAGPGDVATALSAYFDVLNQSVALMDPLDARIQSNRSLLQPVLGAIRDTGHGLITYDRGLNTAQQAAQRENIPAATVFRVLDADLEQAPRIKRYLDRAAFAANQDGSVVVVGRSYPDTVQAMVEWSLEKKDASIAVVPVSAVMKQSQ